MLALPPLVTLLVLGAAVMHAAWNTLLKAGSDKIVMQCLVAVVPAIPALIALLLIPPPNPTAWPFLALSTIVHGFYYVMLINSYRYGYLSQVYPIARGTAPLAVSLGAWIFAAETLRPVEWIGITVVSLGIMSLARPDGVDRKKELKAVGFALATGIAIAIYSVVDGLGVRRTDEPMSYILWLLVLEGLPILPVALWLRRGRIVTSFRPHLPYGTLGGIVLGLGYGIVIWAMDRGPMAHVSALRETSVIFAALIGMTLLGEPFSRRRVMAATLVVLGNGLLHVSAIAFTH